MMVNSGLSGGLYVFIYIYIYWLVVLTILKNDGVRQWDYPIYEMENKIHVPNHQAATY